MLSIFGLGLALVTSAMVDIAVCDTSLNQSMVCGFGYEVLETRLDQLGLKLEESIDQIKAEQISLVNNTNMLLEKILNSLKVIIRQIVSINSCDEATSTGRYRLDLPNRTTPISVVCEMGVFDGGWLVIQQRLDGSVNFNRRWDEYRNGFGVVGQSSEFWLGLEAIHQLTKARNHELLVELKNETGDYGYARYGRFQIAGEAQKYKISSVDEFDGTIGDALSLAKGLNFSTYDRDNDKSSKVNCAQKYGGGSWFGACGKMLINGFYRKDKSTNKGISWGEWTNAATNSRMLIRPKITQKTIS